MRDFMDYERDQAHANATREWGLYRYALPAADEYVPAEDWNDDATLLGTFPTQAAATAEQEAVFARFEAAGHVPPLLDVVPGWVVDGDFIPDE